MWLTIAWLAGLVACVAVLWYSRGAPAGPGRRLSAGGAGIILAALAVTTIWATSNVTTTVQGISTTCGNAMTAKAAQENSDATPLDGFGQACKRAGGVRVANARRLGIAMGGIGLVMILAGALLTAADSRRRGMRREPRSKGVDARWWQYN